MNRRIGTGEAGLEHSLEVKSGTRFAFGKNWSRFVELIDERRLQMAEESLQQMLGCQDLRGRTFLDVGSGSGLFSLAARRLGARVHSFDYDPQSVACTEELKSRYFSGDAAWTIESGSALDQPYLRSLGTFDVVYSWGVLHHTGSLWQALENAIERTAPGGLFFIAIYNDQGRMSRVWLGVKRAYNRLPRGLRWLVLAPALLRLWGPTTVRDLLHRRGFETWRNYPPTQHAGDVRLARCRRLGRRPAFRSRQTRERSCVLPRAWLGADSSENMRRWTRLQRVCLCQNGKSVKR